MAVEKAALRPPPVADDLFELAVEHDIAGQAEPGELGMLEGEPFLWKASLTARYTFLCMALGSSRDQVGWTEVLVVEKGNPVMSRFRMKVRGMDRPALLKFKTVIEARMQRAKALALASVQDRMAKKYQIPPNSTGVTRRIRLARRLAAAESLIERMLPLVPPEVRGAFEDEVQDYVTTYRRGLALGKGEDDAE